jgi:hypothetical protein
MATRACFKLGDDPVFTVTRISYLESQFTWPKPSTEDRKHAPQIQGSVYAKNAPDAALDSPVVIARRIAASVALSSKRRLAPI